MGTRPTAVSESPKPAEIISGKPLIEFLSTGVHPPSRVYVTLQDFLRIVVTAPTTAIAGRINVLARVLRPDGEIIPFRRSIVPTGTLTTENIPLTEGFLLSVSIFPDNQAIAYPGNVYARAYLSRSTDPLTDPYEMLIADYATFTNPATWPERTLVHSSDGAGRLRTIVGTDPGLGVEIAETVPVNTRWELLGFTFTLVTSAVAGSRIVHLRISDGVNVHTRIASPTTQIASQTLLYSYAPGIARMVDANANQTLPLPVPTLLDSSDVISTLTAGLLAGDNFTAPVYFLREWNDEA